MNITPVEFKEWLEILGTPTLGVVAFVILILYREAVIHILKTIVDVVASWIKK